MKQKIFSQDSRSSKGQAAVEFLTTYGWMFMVILVVFGGLVYFGFTDGKNKIPTSCRFDTTFECLAFHAVEDGSYSLEIKNIDSKQINLTHFICGFPQSEDLVRYNYSDTAFDPGQTRTYYCDSADLLPATILVSGKDLFEMKIAYRYIENEPIPIIVDGELVTDASDDVGLLANYQGASQVSTLITLITP